MLKSVRITCGSVCVGAALLLVGCGNAGETLLLHKPFLSDAGATPPDSPTNGLTASGSAEAQIDEPDDPVESDGGSDAGTDADEVPELSDEGMVHSMYCGDGVLGLDEQCDTGRPNEFCTERCRARATLLIKELGESVAAATELMQLRPSSSALQSTDSSLVASSGRVIGNGAHPVAASFNGFAAAFMDLEGDATVAVQLFDHQGFRLGEYALGNSFSFVDIANPVMAPLPDGTFAVAWAAFNADGDELGIELQRVDLSTGPIGDPIVANSTTVGAQYAPDIAWTGDGLVVAWTDASDFEAGPDVKYSIFTEALTRTSPEATLGGGAYPQGDVVLVPFAGSWAAAYRSVQGDGNEAIAISTPVGDFSVPDLYAGATDDHPVMAELDSTHLLLAFSAGTDPQGTGVFNTPRLRYAVVDTNGPTTLSPTSLATVTPPYSTDATIPQLEPSLAQSMGSFYLSWRSGAVAASARGEEVWIKALSWDGATLNVATAERPLPNSNLQRFGDQRSPKLTGAVVPSGGPIFAIYVDYGNNIDGAESPDIVAQMRGFPVETCFSYVQQATPPFSLGMPVTPDGTAARPYPICLIEQLQHVVDTPSLQSKNFILGADLDLRGLDGALGRTTAFTGTFDGDDYLLAYYESLRPSATNVGFIEQLAGDGAIDGSTDGELKNVTFLQPTVEGGSYVGAAVGRVTASASITNIQVNGGSVTGGGLTGGVSGNVLGRIADSRSSATVTGSGASAAIAGGLVGELGAGSFAERCSTSGVTSFGSSVGGVVGKNSGSIQRSYATGAVSGSTQVGGLVGEHSGSLSDSYARGAVTGSQAGGLVGQMNASATVTRTYASGAVTPGTQTGGLVGTQTGSPTYAGSVWNTTTNSTLSAIGSSGTPPSGVVGKTSAEMKARATYLAQGWDFLSTWAIDDGVDYPIPFTSAYDFCGQVPQQATAPFAIGLGADGTASKPYPLCTVAQMQSVANTTSLWNKQFKLMTDLQLSTLTGAIGTSTNPFSGVFDGNGRQLGEFTRSSNTNHVGLFGYVQGGTIKNLTITNFNVSGESYVGGLVGYVASGTLDSVNSLGGLSVGSSGSTTRYVGGLVGFLGGAAINCNSSTLGALIGVTVSPTDDPAGGLVGFVSSTGSVKKSSSTGLVTFVGAAGVGAVGGLVGQLSGLVEDSSSSATVQANSQERAGGLVGDATSGSIVRRSYATGPVTAVTYVGGLVGAAATTTVENSWASGPVSASGQYSGGLIGRSDDGSVMRSYAIGTVSGASEVGGLIGYVSGTSVSDSYARGNVSNSTTGGAGALFGQTSGGTMSNDYASGAVTGSGTRGGVVGTRSTGTYTACLWNTTATPGLNGAGSGATTGLFGKTEVQLKQQATYTAQSWEFTTIWKINEGVSFAELR